MVPFIKFKKKMRIPINKIRLKLKTTPMGSNLFKLNEGKRWLFNIMEKNKSLLNDSDF